MANTIDDIRIQGYTMLIDSNGGEGQLVLSMVANQAGHTHWRITTVEVDGVEFMSISGVVQTGQAFEGIFSLIIDWLVDGKPHDNPMDLNKDSQWVRLELSKFLGE